MLEMKKVKNGAYDEYEQLLLRREHYRKEAGQALINYTREFSDMINAAFEKLIECIRLKKIIAMCQTYINRGQSIDVDVMEETIRREMAHYYAELEEKLAGTEAAKHSSLVPAAVVMEVKRIYRKLAKLLHPDTHPITDTVPELKNLWNRITIAYHNNDLEELQELEALALAAADRLGIGGGPIEIPDIREKIARLEREINELITSAPYIYKILLADPAKVEKKKEALQTEMKDYDDYIQELQEQLDEMLMASGRRITWRMNLH